MHDGEKQLLYKTTGTCCQYIEVAVKDSKLTKCCFYGGCNGMAGFRGRNDALGFCKQTACLECTCLSNIYSLYKAFA